MKKLVYIILLCLTQLGLNAQSNFERLNTSDQMGQEKEEGEAADSIPENTIPHERITWKWKQGGLYKEMIPLDTLADGIHNYNYIFKQSIANTYLGNFPSPYQSDIYMLRAEDEPFFQLTPVRAYLFKPVDMLNFNSSTPFTQLNFFTGGGKGKAETMVDVWHAQNITPFWSFGFRYNLISSDGRYMNQKAKAYNLSLFSSYERDRIAATFFINQNNGHFNENGGVADRNDILNNEDNEKTENIAVNITNGLKNVYRNFNFNVMGQYSIGGGKEVVVGEDTVTKYPAKVTMDLTVEDNMYKLKENPVPVEFFPNTYIDSTEWTNFIDYKRVNLSTKLVLNEHPRFKGVPGVYAGLDYEWDKYSEPLTYDTATRVAIRGNRNHNNVMLTAGFFNLDTTTLANYKVDGRLSLVGDYIGNFNIKGLYQQAFNKEKTSFLEVKGEFDLESPDPFYDQLINNHFIWKNDFKDVKHLSGSVKYVNTKWRSEFGVGGDQVFGMLYLNRDTLPAQENAGIMIATAWAKQHFTLGKFHFDQTAYMQMSSNGNVIDLPLLSVYSHNYYQNELFKKVLKLQVGIDVFYNTAFYADNYDPGLMQFYNQRVAKTGNYPKVDVFATLGIKRSVFFLKYEHVNFLITNGEYFSALDYPINPAMFKFGIRWNFFD